MEKIIGWKLDRDQRAELLLQFPPIYANAVADHVTLGRAPAEAPLPEAAEAEIVGRADDGAGVEAMVVRLNGTTDRPDGSTFHITWSLAENRAAKESNEVIAARGWASLDLPMPVILIPRAGRRARLKIVSTFGRRLLQSLVALNMPGLLSRPSPACGMDRLAVFPRSSPRGDP